jgi:hypothetical protein
MSSALTLKHHTETMTARKVLRMYEVVSTIYGTATWSKTNFGPTGCYHPQNRPSPWVCMEQTKYVPTFKIQLFFKNNLTFSQSPGTQDQIWVHRPHDEQINEATTFFFIFSFRFDYKFPLVTDTFTIKHIFVGFEVLAAVTMTNVSSGMWRHVGLL